MSNVEVRKQDILSQPLEEASYDLIHARLVVEHLTGPDRLLEMMARALRPGGWLVVESMDVLGVHSADPSHPASATVDRVVNGSLASIAEASTWDLGFTRVMPKAFYGLGLVNNGHEVSSWLGRGGDLKSDEYELSMRSTADRLVESGAIDGSDMDALFEALQDPDFWFVTPSMIAAWGQAPPRP